MIDFSQFNSLMTMTGYFNSEDICRQAVVNSRYNKGKVVCPHCGSHRISVRQDGRYRCKYCKHNFSCLVGTIFENTNLPLQKWFIAMYLISSHKKGISSCQLARDIKVSQTTAWNMLHKVRKLYAQDDSDALKGTVECDEVYIGGKEKWKHQSMKTPRTQGRSTKTKTPVFGMMERTEIENAKGEMEFMSYVKALVVENTTSATLKPVISQFIADGSTVYTDELGAYNGLANMGYSHNICNHSGLEFVTEDGEVYTNNIEGFWSHFRRMITGCYHDCSDEHLQAYVDEACFRWNTRKMSESERFGIMFRKSVGLVVRWKDLALCDRKKVA